MRIVRKPISPQLRSDNAWRSLWIRCSRALRPAVFPSVDFLRRAFPQIILLISFLFLGACDETEPIPAYLQIDTFDLQLEAATQGSESNKITDVWVTVDGLFLGVYDLPATVPVLAAGDVEVRLEAGVLENGRSVTPNIYPFYEPFVRNLTLVPEQTTTVAASTTYRANTQLAFIENFEPDQPRVFTIDWFGLPELTVTEEVVFEGQASGELRLDENSPLVVIATEFDFSDLLSQTNPNVWLEVNYRSTAAVAWGVVGIRTFSPVEVFNVGFVPNEEWNKIYLNLGQSIFDSDLEEYGIALQAFLSVQGQTEAVVYLDNIKLLYF
jgi:hypothetical protein